MKKPLRNLLPLAVACGAVSAICTDIVTAQSCYTSVGPASILRFGAGPVQQCNTTDGFGSPIIGAFFNTTFSSNTQVRKAYRQAGRDAERAYKDGVRCVNKLLENGAIDAGPADEHKYHLETEFEDLQAAWEDWYEDYYGELCN